MDILLFGLAFFITINLIGVVINSDARKNRKILFNYLKKNDLPESTSVGDSHSKWLVCGHEITLVDNKYWFAFYGHRLSIGGFIGDVFDYLRYRDILKRLKESNYER